MKIKLLILSVLLLLTGGFFIFSGGEEPDEGPDIRMREPANYETESVLERKRGVSPPEIEAEAVYAVYLEGEDKEVLFSRNRNASLPIASLTKLVTALVVYENLNLDEPIGIPDSDLFTDAHLRDLRVFPETTFGELLYPLLLESNNSSAYAAATAETDFDDFMSFMNQKADRLGMRQTHFYNPSGLDNIRGVNRSSPRDLVKLTERILEIPLFWEIMRRPTYNITSRSSDLHYRVETTNQFLDGSYFGFIAPEWLSDIKGGKTGFTYRAGGTLLMVLEPEEGSYLIYVILGSEGHNERFEEMEKLINWTYKAYKI